MSETPVETVPTIAAESVETQYGLKYPNGTIDWAKSDGSVELSNGGAWQLFSLKAPSAEMSQFLAQRAIAARIEPETYLLSHQVVSRTVTTLVSEPVPAEMAPVQ